MSHTGWSWDGERLDQDQVSHGARGYCGGHGSKARSPASSGMRRNTQAATTDVRGPGDQTMVAQDRTNGPGRPGAGDCWTTVGRPGPVARPSATLRTTIGACPASRCPGWPASGPPHPALAAAAVGRPCRGMPRAPAVRRGRVAPIGGGGSGTTCPCPGRGRPRSPEERGLPLRQPRHTELSPLCQTVAPCDGAKGAHRALCPRCATTAGSHGSQGPEVCTPDAVLNGSCTLL